MPRLVVNEGGELLRFKAMQQDLLYESLLKNHCYHTAYYLNSFDRLSLQENRARALFLERGLNSELVRQITLYDTQYPFMNMT